MQRYRMNGIEMINTRRSIRTFSPQPIPQSVLDDMIAAAQNAPSCQNKQCWRFIVITNPGAIGRLATHAGFIGTVNFFIKQAPMVVVACADPARSCVLNGQDYYLADTAMAFQQMMLAAWSHGVGSCWLGAFNEKSLRKEFGIPQNIRVVGMSPFGYPARKSSLYAKAVKAVAKGGARLSKEKIVCYESWSL